MDRVHKYLISMGCINRVKPSDYVPPGLTLQNSTLCTHTCIYVFSVWTSEQTAIISLRNINPLTPNDAYRRRTTPLTSKRCILYIYSTNIGIEYFKHGIYSAFFRLQNSVCFIILTYLVTVFFTFYIQGVLKFKKK